MKLFENFKTWIEGIQYQHEYSQGRSMVKIDWWSKTRNLKGYPNRNEQHPCKIWVCWGHIQGEETCSSHIEGKLKQRWHLQMLAYRLGLQSIPAEQCSTQVIILLPLSLPLLHVLLLSTMSLHIPISISIKILDPKSLIDSFIKVRLGFNGWCCAVWCV